ncbi:MAG: hypothetical protein H6667_10855 [Ardenticatenaceae bacterium]|nr:hypothetical protein [Ardenticatenaceae bacterium]MCB9444398.1 hypothetical protein [Ardenticatenaceae bacterium]
MKFPVYIMQNRHIDRISAADIDIILASVFDQPLDRLGFEKVNQRKWVRATKPDIREMFAILAMKGASYSPAWGFSLDYVPHISGNKLKWHRTNKSALFDFRYDPLDYKTIGNFDLESWRIDSLYGKEKAIKQARQVAKISIEQANQLWNSIQNPNDIPRVFEEQLRLTKERKVQRFGFFNYTQHPIAYAFTLAKIGEREKARKMLEETIQRGGVAQKCEDDLKQKLSDLLALEN